MTDHRAVVLACRAHARDVEVATTGTPFTRASTATYTDVAGVVQTAALNVYRDAHYVNAVLTPLYEAAATNLCARSAEFDQWSTSGALAVANSIAAPDGTTTADTVENDGGTVDGRLMKAVTFTGNGTKCVSVYLKEKSTNRPTGIGLLTGGVSVIRRVRVTWSGGVPTLSSVTGSGTLHTVEALANGWYRVAFNADSYTATGDDWVAVYPWDTCDGTADSSGVYAWGAQVEEASAPTSYIPTTATTATRAADTGGLAATTSGFTRTSGSFLTDGFRIGQEVTPTGFTSSSVGTITAVTATAMTVTGTRTADAAGGGRTLAVNLPASVAYLNVPHEPTVGAPWVEEQYLPGSADQYTVATTGTLETLPIYALTVYGPTGIDIAGLMGYADALLDHFAPGTPLTVASGDLRVRARPAPFASPVQIVDGGWAAVTVSVPLRYHTANPR